MIAPTINAPLKCGHVTMFSEVWKRGTRRGTGLSLIHIFVVKLFFTCALTSQVGFVFIWGASEIVFVSGGNKG